MKRVLKKVFTLSILTVFLTVAAAWSEDVVRMNGSTTVQKRIMEPGKEALEKATVDVLKQQAEPAEAAQQAVDSLK